MGGSDGINVGGCCFTERDSPQGRQSLTTRGHYVTILSAISHGRS
jgi:hypothetical protein